MSQPPAHQLQQRQCRLRVLVTRDERYPDASFDEQSEFWHATADRAPGGYLNWPLSNRDPKRLCMKDLNDAGVVIEFTKMLTGLKMDSVYERYSIAPPDLLEAAVAKLSAHLDSPAKGRTAGRMGTHE